jgi:hypothetical protein
LAGKMIWLILFSYLFDNKNAAWFPEKVLNGN